MEMRKGAISSKSKIINRQSTIVNAHGIDVIAFSVAQIGVRSDVLLILFIVRPKPDDFHDSLVSKDFVH